MTKESLEIKLTREEIEILMYALFNLMKVKVYQGEIPKLEELHNKLAAVYNGK